VRPRATLARGIHRDERLGGRRSALDDVTDEVAPLSLVSGHVVGYDTGIGSDPGMPRMERREDTAAPVAAGRRMLSSTSPWVATWVNHSPGELAARTVELLDAAYRSAERGGLERVAGR